MAFSCPNKNDQSWKDLVKEVGYARAYELYVSNDFNFPNEDVVVDSGIIPLKGNESLYKQYNLLNEKGQIKQVDPDADKTKKWLEINNNSPYYSFILRQTPRGSRIFIANKIKKRDAQLSMFQVDSYTIENEMGREYWKDLYTNRRLSNYEEFESVKIPTVKDKFQPDYENIYHGTNTYKIDSDGNLILVPSKNFENQTNFRKFLFHDHHIRGNFYDFRLCIFESCYPTLYRLWFHKDYVLYLTLVIFLYHNIHMISCDHFSKILFEQQHYCHIHKCNSSSN